MWGPRDSDLHDHELLDLGVHHVLEGVGGVLLELLEVARPGLVDPVDLPDYPGSCHLGQGSNMAGWRLGGYTFWAIFYIFLFMFFVT